MQLHGSGRINSQGHLEIGGVDTCSLVEKYGSPLFVYDEGLIRDQCRRFHKVLSKSGLDYHISYASKAFICKELVRIMKEEDMGLDVVSVGELYNALSVDFDSQKIHLHGNNKTEYEIGYALENNIGCFVIDSLAELERLNRIGGQMGKRAKALLRVTPGVEAHTHEFITTGNTDSKFGLNIDNGQAREGIEAILRAENIDLIGLHFHIGSQIFGTEGSQAAIKKVFAWLKDLKEDLDFEAKILNIGGGFGIRYTDEDVSYPIEDALEEIIACLKEWPYRNCG